MSRHCPGQKGHWSTDRLGKLFPSLEGEGWEWGGGGSKEAGQKRLVLMAYQYTRVMM